MTETDIEFYETEDSLDLEADEETKERWKISGKSTADWTLAVRKRSETEISDALKLRDERIERANEHFADVQKREQSTIDFFDHKLREWYETYLVPEGLVDDKRKTYKNLENGTVGKEKAGLKLITDDPDALLAWLRQGIDTREAFIKIEESVRIGELKKALPVADKDKVGRQSLMASDGEIIPGAYYERGDQTFVVKTS